MSVIQMGIVASAKKAYNYIVNNWVVDNGDGTIHWLNTVGMGSLNTDGSFAVRLRVRVGLRI